MHGPSAWSCSRTTTSPARSGAAPTIVGRIASVRSEASETWRRPTSGRWRSDDAGRDGRRGAADADLPAHRQDGRHEPAEGAPPPVPLLGDPPRRDAVAEPGAPPPGGDA